MSNFDSLEQCKKRNPDGVYVQVQSGRYIDLNNPRPSDISVDDIAHGLSMICRFNGHSSAFYSVAQHSVLVSYLVPPKFAMEGLLHDAAEAYLGDIVTPLKQCFPAFNELECKFRSAIKSRFELQSGYGFDVQQQDLVALATEVRDLMPAAHIIEWGIQRVEPAEHHIVPQLPAAAREMFMNRFYELVGDANEPMAA